MGTEHNSSVRGRPCGTIQNQRKILLVTDVIDELADSYAQRLYQELNGVIGAEKKDGKTDGLHGQSVRGRKWIINKERT